MTVTEKNIRRMRIVTMWITWEEGTDPVKGIRDLALTYLHSTYPRSLQNLLSHLLSVMRPKEIRRLHSLQANLLHRIDTPPICEISIDYLR